MTNIQISDIVLVVRPVPSGLIAVIVIVSG